LNRRKEIKKYLYQSFLSEFGGELTIYDSRQLPFQETEVPFLLYSIPKEESELSSESTQEAKKRAELSVEVILGDSTELTWLMDDITARVENLFIRDRFLGDLVTSIHLRSTETGINQEGEELIGLARMNFELSYFAKPSDPANYLRVTDFTKKVIHWSKNDYPV
jgi:hypothetical protein